jgi:hypothetical protein
MKQTKTITMRRTNFAASSIVLVLAASTPENAHAERWVQASPTDARMWYDADNIRSTGDRLIGVWISTGPNRTNTGTNGKKSYPVYSIINCRQRTAGSKMKLDLGEALIPYASNSGMGELIEKLCS